MQTNYIEYQLGDLTMQGFVARKASATTQPIVLVVHDWSGCRELVQDKAKYFAEQGYVGFAVDLYGIGKRGSDTDSSLNQKLMGEVMQDRATIIPRLQAALDCAKNLENVHTCKIMVVGFCFGGLCALDFARSGADVSGVVSVHGLLNNSDAAQKSKINSKILAIHGYLDKMGTPEILAAFQAEMTSRGADWQTHVLGNASHAFTNPRANDPAMGLKYDSIADARTWAIIKAFAGEIFG